MADLYLKPAPGRRVLDPVTHEPLAPEGEVKPRTGFWLRRLKDGDVEDLAAPPQPHGSAVPAKPARKDKE
jgi:hypothetical protein